jgi:hypothetical protein
MAPGETTNMSTRLLYHGFGVRGDQYVRCHYGATGIRFMIQQGRLSLRCSACGSAEVHPHGASERHLRTVSVGPRAVSVTFAIPRVYCVRCGVTRQVKVAFADPRRSDTKTFDRFALGLHFPRFTPLYAAKLSSRSAVASISAFQIPGCRSSRNSARRSSRRRVLRLSA